MIDLLPTLKDLAELGITPVGGMALFFLFKFNKITSGFDKRLALLEQAAEKCAKC
ncbi:hypothetical protein [Colwellia sp. E2M01]|uniref:hypothetical protein n=1 Tax=Colwellia sp. E2M01 TaxID=2841561 RepID=UPI001C08E2EF|nr:hypothetical protein [Colwellia sp. E2M01]MBU2871966.1 hypothetical protein [Colwellia sp. E2M01]